MDRQGVDTAGQFGRQCRIHHAVPVDPAASAERLGHDPDPKMRLAARPVAGMAGVQVGLVRDIQALRRESLGQLPGDLILGRHALWLKRAPTEGQPYCLVVSPTEISNCQDLKVCCANPHNTRS